MTKTKKKDIPKPHEPYRIEMETMREPQVTSREIWAMIFPAPDAFNGNVHVRKYKITAEMIDEPIEVIQSRIQELWDNCASYQLWEPLKYMASRYGMELSHDTQKKRWV